MVWSVVNRAELTYQEGKMELTVRSKNVDLTTTWDKLHIPTQNSQLRSVSLLR